MFFNLETGEVINRFEMRKRYPKISFPSQDAHREPPKGRSKPPKGNNKSKYRPVFGNGPKAHIVVPGDNFIPPDPWVPFIPDTPPPTPEP